jgi:hypothetical protein
MSNATYGTDGLLATTLKAYRPTLEDNVFTSKILLWILKNAGSIESQDGGEKIVQPLMYAEAPNKGSYEGSDVFNTADNTGISAAEFPWRQYYGLFSITGIEKAKNSGKSALLKLVKARLLQLEMTIAEQMEVMFFGDGSGNGQKDWYGLGAIVDSSNPAWGNLGGIDRSANSYWQSYESALGGALTLAAMSTAYNTTSEGADHPSNILTTQTLYEAYETLVVAKLQLEDTKMGDAGFQNLLFKGAPMAFSANVTSGDVLFLNMQYIKLTKLGNVWFQPSEMMQPTNQDAFYQHLLCYGNMNVSNCKRQGKITGAT